MHSKQCKIGKFYPLFNRYNTAFLQISILDSKHTSMNNVDIRLIFNIII